MLERSCSCQYLVSSHHKERGWRTMTAIRCRHARLEYKLCPALPLTPWSTFGEMYNFPLSLSLVIKSSPESVEKKLELTWEIDAKWQQLYDENSKIEICVRGGVPGTVVKSNYTNGYSGLEWSRANAEQSLMKNRLFLLPHLSCSTRCAASRECERDWDF